MGQYRRRIKVMIDFGSCFILYLQTFCIYTVEIFLVHKNLDFVRLYVLGKNAKWKAAYPEPVPVLVLSSVLNPGNI